ncbi:MAG TPA: hypothetical protein VMY77_15890 [Chitinophagaceae bacterium]|nr:hypothetical protein [Chitinophagaceae bacterium]
MLTLITVLLGIAVIALVYGIFTTPSELTMDESRQSDAVSL